VDWRCRAGRVGGEEGVLGGFSHPGLVGVVGSSGGGAQRLVGRGDRVGFLRTEYLAMIPG
jgi:hypothetical protein